jgi:hypothetical protein
MTNSPETASPVTECDYPRSYGRAGSAVLGGFADVVGGCASRTRTGILSRPRTGGRARDAGLVPGGPEGRRAAEPVLAEPAGTGGTAAYGAVPPAQQDPDVAGKLQPATLESLTIFSRNILLVFDCECKLRADTGDQAAQAVS